MSGQVRAAIMQPYFLPYIGYWQLMAAVDVFVVYDDIEYTKKGWINRNRMLVNGKDDLFSVPLKKDSDYLPVSQRALSDAWPEERERLLRRFENAYRKAPCFAAGMDVLRQCLLHDDRNLFGFIFHSIQVVRAYLGITTPLVVSSTLDVPPGLKGQDRVMATCRAVGANAYLNPIGGVELYDRSAFASAGISLAFQRVLPVEYPQWGQPFVPFLSIIDLIMFNDREALAGMLTRMETF